MQKTLLSLLLAAALPALAQTPPTKSETVKARYCPEPAQSGKECSKVEITRLIFADNPGLTAFSDRLLRDSVSDLNLPDFDQKRVQKELEKAVNETKDEEGYLRLEYQAENTLFGYSPDYLTIRNEMWIYGGGPHGNGGDYYITLPRRGGLKALTADDILLPGKKAAFVAAVKEALTDYLKPDTLRFDFDQDYKNANFDWSPDENGLFFNFNPYSLGDYLTTASFTLPADKLKGIIKPEFLQQLKAFKKTKESKSN
ncbi:MAG: hypothetical protein Q3966_02305 [Neisseria sp.]|nr:hypothetical protein [Neisseria sp.]